MRCTQNPACNFHSRSAICSSLSLGVKRVGFSSGLRKYFGGKKMKGCTKVWYQRRADQQFPKITGQGPRIIAHKALNKDSGMIIKELVVTMQGCGFACLLVRETSTGSQQVRVQG